MEKQPHVVQRRCSHSVHYERTHLALAIKTRKKQDFITHEDHMVTVHFPLSLFTMPLCNRLPLWLSGKRMPPTTQRVSGRIFLLFGLICTFLSNNYIGSIHRHAPCSLVVFRSAPWFSPVTELWCLHVPLCVHPLSHVLCINRKLSLLLYLVCLFTGVCTI